MVLDWNETAIGFYQRLGATILADWRMCRFEEAQLAGVAGTFAIARGGRPGLRRPMTKPAAKRGGRLLHSADVFEPQVRLMMRAKDSGIKCAS